MPISSKRRRDRKVRREVKNKVRRQQQQQQQQQRGGQQQPNEMLMKMMMMLSANGNKNSNDVANSLNQKEMMVSLKNEKEKRKKEMKVMEENHKVSMEKMKNDYELVLQQIREELQKAKDEGVQNEHNAEVQQLQHDVEQQKQKNEHQIKINSVKAEMVGMQGKNAELTQQVTDLEHQLELGKQKIENIKSKGDVEAIEKQIKELQEKLLEQGNWIQTFGNLTGQYASFKRLKNELNTCVAGFANVIEEAEKANSVAERLEIYKGQKLTTLYNTVIGLQEAFKRTTRENQEKIDVYERKRGIIHQTELGNVDLEAENTMLDKKLKNLMYDVDEGGNLTDTPIDYNARYQAVFTDRENYNKNIRESKRSINSYEQADDLIFNMNDENQKLSAEYNALGKVYDGTKYNANLKAIGEKKAEIDKLKEQIAEKKQKGVDTKKLEKRLKDVNDEVAVLTAQNDKITQQPVTPTKFKQIGEKNAEIEQLQNQIAEKKHNNARAQKIAHDLKEKEDEQAILTAQNEKTTVEKTSDKQLEKVGELQAQIAGSKRTLNKKLRGQNVYDKFEQEIDDKENENKIAEATAKATSGDNDKMQALINRQVAANKEKELNDQLRMTHKSEQEKRMSELQANAENSENIKATEDRIITEKVKQKQNEEESQRLLLLKQEQEKTARAVSQQKVNQELLKHRNENDGIIDAAALLTAANECIDNSNAQFRDDQEYIDNSYKRYKRMAATNAGFVPVVSGVLNDWNLPPINNDDDIRKYTSNVVKAGAFEELINAIGKSMDELKEGEQFDEEMLDGKIDVEEVYNRLNQEEK